MTTFTSIAGLLGIVVLVSAAWATYKATKGSKVAERAASDTGILSIELTAYKEGYERLSDALTHANTEIAGLKASRELTPLMEKFADLMSQHERAAAARAERLIEAFTTHEAAVASRAERMIQAIEALPDRIAQSSNGGRT